MLRKSELNESNLNFKIAGLASATNIFIIHRMIQRELREKRSTSKCHKYFIADQGTVCSCENATNKNARIPLM